MRACGNLVSQGADLRLSGGQRELERVPAADHPLDVAVNDDRPLVEGDGRDGGSGEGADPGQGQQVGFIARKLPLPSLRDLDRAFVQVAGAGVVPQSGPGRQHIVKRRGSEVGNRRPAVGKGLEIALYGCHGGLLQHNFRQPDVIGVGGLARPRPPRQIAPVLVVPVEQAVGKVSLQPGLGSGKA